MFDVLILRVIPYIVAALVAFGGGWYFNGLRWQSIVHEMKLTQAGILAKAVDDARAREYQLAEVANNLKEAKDAEIRAVNSRLAAALVELRNRPPRPTPGAASTSISVAPASGGTGALLYREDAEFLAREAARADEIRASLIQCVAQYDEAAKDGRR